jgi:type I restriction enzyme S subunit
MIENLDLVIPQLPEQQAIASILSSLDDKIDLLQRQNRTLGRLAEALFRHWFVEEAAESWESRKLEEFFPVITGKRDANYGSEDGIYPFFTCSQKVLKCAYYSYEGHAILLAGNGDFNLKRYKGRFEAYQRTYVLIPREEKYVGFLFYLMKYFLNEMTSGAQGSVISFLTKGMITQFQFRFPEVEPESQLRQLNLINEHIDSNATQIRTLNQLRDELLPKLMSGAIRVSL